jgi:hypothetical protein
MRPGGHDLHHTSHDIESDGHFDDQLSVRAETNPVGLSHDQPAVAPLGGLRAAWPANANPAVRRRSQRRTGMSGWLTA